MKPIGVPTGRIRSFHGFASASILVLLVGVSCAPPEEPTREQAEAHSAAPSIDISRSVLVTDLETLEAKNPQGRVRFSLQRVLGHLAATSGDSHGLDAAGLYERLFDVNNDKAGGYVADGQHCDDEKDGNGRPVLNGFPIECPRQEGRLANLQKHNPFCSGPNCDPYTPVAISNRFDLAPPNGENCGQYRIVFAKGVEQEPLATAGNPLLLNRVFIIVETVMPNPKPHRGIEGCAKVVDFWADLSKENDPRKRARALDEFFFAGTRGIERALDWSHLAGGKSGQIRMNLFMNDPATGGGEQMWQLREYNLARTCTGAGKHRNCRLKAKMVPTQVNPPAELFDEANQSAAALAFRNPNYAKSFISQVKWLAADDINRIDLSRLGIEFNNGQSTSSPAFLPGLPPLDDANYNLKFDPNGAFAADIQAALDAIPSALTPPDVIKRAQTQACAGCHELSTSTALFFGGMAQANVLGNGKIWPDAAEGPELPGFGRLKAFTHISDALLVPLDDGVTCDTACTAHAETCRCAWAASDALNKEFLPFRVQRMKDFLNSRHGHGHGQGDDDD